MLNFYINFIYSIKIHSIQFFEVKNTINDKTCNFLSHINNPLYEIIETNKRKSYKLCRFLNLTINITNTILFSFYNQRNPRRKF